jgi:hypothetical protein
MPKTTNFSAKNNQLEKLLPCEKCMKDIHLVQSRSAVISCFQKIEWHF